MTKHRLINLILSTLMVVSMVLGGSSQAIASPAVRSTDASPAGSSPTGSLSASPSAAETSQAAQFSPVDESKVPHYFGPYSNYANSQFTQADVAVDIVGDGAGATAIASVGADGSITGITVTNPGSGYTTATVNITGGGSGAAADALITTSGSVSAINVLQNGSGYTEPSVSIAGGATISTPASVTAAPTRNYDVSAGSATGGTFTLTVDTVTTGGIAWNALAADVETALTTAGVAATVTGSGPWTVVFAVAPTSVSIDPANLTQPGPVAVTDASVSVAPTRNYDVSAGSADGGTFTLSVDAATTAAIAWNAAALDVENALLAAGVTASVTGSGPWAVTFASAPGTVSIDQTGLTQTLAVTDGSVTAASVFNVSAGSADGGTFTISVDAATTAAIAWNAAALDVENALLAVGVTASVTGSGPWIVTFASAPTTVSIDPANLTQTGAVTDSSASSTADPLVFNANVGSASGGTFTLSVDAATTGAVAWNAAALDVENALAAAGVTAAVTGSGSSADPYVITFTLAPTSVTLDPTNLTQNLPVADANAAAASVYDVSAGSANGGTFTLTVDAATTGAVAWNAVALELQNALSAAGVAASVTGTGPWVVTFSSAPGSVSLDQTGLTQTLTVTDGSASATATNDYNVSAGSADGGTFTITVDAAVTGAIAWNAAALDVQNALSAAGVVATVTGSGPWVVAFASIPVSVTLDQTNLTQTGSVAVTDASASATASSDYDLSAGSATGGTFALTVDAATTGAVAWNAAATDIETALSAAGVTATATGTGPWVVTFASAPTAVSIDPAGLIASPASGAAATAYGSVDSLTLTQPGTGYTMPTVDFDMPDDPNGVQARAHVIWDQSTGAVYGIQLDNPGSGYATAPKVVIRDGTVFSPLKARLRARADAARAQVLSESGRSSLAPDQASSPDAIVNATATATIDVQNIVLNSYGTGYSGSPAVTISDLTGKGTGATATAVTDIGAVTAITVTASGSGYITSGGIRKFQDGLPQLCNPSVAGDCDAVKNNLGQYMPLAVPDTTTFTTANGFPNDADFYVIALVQHRERMSSSLPAAGTLNREYVQLETPANANWSKHIPLMNDLQDGTSVPALMPDGTQAYAVDDPHYMGPIISATSNKPVRLQFFNLLPTGSDGDLFIPVDTTFMGSGTGPDGTIPMPMDMGTVTDTVRNPICGDVTKDRSQCFADTRAVIHLHGGITPWISDGSPHQWITPANEQTGWPQAVSVSEVPDMVGQGAATAGIPDCSADNDGCTTFYYTNQQSARLMFYHDHAWGITRLNVYVGEAAGYLITDDTEQKLMAAGGPLADVGTGIPLVIQDRTYVPDAAQMAAQDPTWDYNRWGGQGDLWYEHVYMTAQNPADPTGLSAYGRWMYGPWFWPPATPTYGPIANPYYNMDPLGPDGVRGTSDDFTTPLAKPCNLDDSSTWQYQTDPFCEPPYIPGTPNNSAGMEQFNDTPIVNGTAYPTITLDPKAYRFRILNAANDRFFNFQWYVADPNTASTALNGMGQPIGGTEVALKASEVAAAQTDPNVFPTPDTTISPPGPSWIQIGTESGFLPSPVVVPNQPITWITDPTRFDFGNVDQHALLIAPAERADVIVDFSKFAGQTLILYNDAPAAFPARVACYDYYTGGPDLWPACAPTTLPGYGPNTRTIMQVKIAAATPAPAYNLSALNAAFKHHADGSGVFESGQKPIIVGQAAYNQAYGSSFAASGNCNSAIPSAKCDGYARIDMQGGMTFNFDTLVGAQIGVNVEPKALHDEMNSTTFEPFGRMTGNIGVEAVPATAGLQNVTLYPFVNPPTELFDATNLPTSDTFTPISVGTDGTQIWKITHNGVDTHPIHFHLYDVQVLDRVTWDNIIIPPDPNELGWKDTVRVSPLEDTYFAIRPIIPSLPWEIPNNIRPLNPMMPEGDTSMFNNVDPNGNPTTPIVNQLINFGWEYMLHCHILSHEEMDMMRPVSVAVPPYKPDGLAFTVSGNGNRTRLTLTWNDNSINETAFLVQRSVNGGPWVDLGTDTSPIDQPNTHGVRSYVDRSFRMDSNAYSYRVLALNTIGLGGAFPSKTAQSVSDVLPIIYPPTNLTASLQLAPAAALALAPSAAYQVSLSWTDNSLNETGFVVERSDNGGPFAQIGTVPAHSNTGAMSYVDTTVAQSQTYTYRVAVLTPGGNAYSALVPITIDLPLAPSNLQAIPVVTSNNKERVVLAWADNSNNEAGFTIQWSTDPTFASLSGTANVGPDSITYITGNLAQQNWNFRIQAYNVIGTSAWVTVQSAQPAALVAPNNVVAPLVFMNSFSTGLASWMGQVGNVQASSAASMGSVDGQGLAASMGAVVAAHSATSAGAQPAYVYDQTPDMLEYYVGNFFFDPNGAITGDNPVDIFLGLDDARAPVFGIQFQHALNEDNGYQIRGWAKTAAGDVYTDWVTIRNAPQNLQLDWHSNKIATVTLSVDGDMVASLSGDTSGTNVDEVRLGPSRGMEDSASSLTSPSGTMYFDTYMSLGAETDMLPTIFMPVINK